MTLITFCESKLEWFFLVDTFAFPRTRAVGSARYWDSAHVGNENGLAQPDTGPELERIRTGRALACDGWIMYSTRSPIVSFGTCFIASPVLLTGSDQWPELIQRFFSDALDVRQFLDIRELAVFLAVIDDSSSDNRTDSRQFLQHLAVSRVDIHE